MTPTKRSSALGLVVAAALYLTSVGEAHAYLDPGTGSVIFQAVAAAIAGTALVLRMYWRKIKGLFSRGQGAADDPNALPAESDQDANDSRGRS